MVSGTIKDRTGALIPGASVTLTNTATNVSAKTVANGTGFYVFPGVTAGPYTLTAESPGMQKFEGTLTVQSQESTVVDITLNVGLTTAQVAVTEVTPLVQTDNATPPATPHPLPLHPLPTHRPT